METIHGYKNKLLVAYIYIHVCELVVYYY